LKVPNGVCQLDGCEVELIGQQTKFCSGLHKKRAYWAEGRVTATPRDRERTKKWIRANPERQKMHQRRHILWKRYGLSPEDYDALVAKQDGRCAICLSKSTGPWGVLVVDHNHDTNRVRGLLCHACNVGIGQMKDDPRIVRRALNYLEGQ
jgi:hypothetical protein